MSHAKSKPASKKTLASSQPSNPIPPGYQSWVKNVIAPALVKIYLEQLELRKRGRHA
jgi:hypothetical protein